MKTQNITWIVISVGDIEHVLKLIELLVKGKLF